jgi:hypothetical protein
MGLSADQQLLLAPQQRGNLESDPRLRMPASAAAMDREALFSFAAQSQGLSARSGVDGSAGLSEGLLLQLLGERQRQQMSFDSVQQHLQRQAFARDLAEREYERNIVQRLGAAGAGFGGSPFASALDSHQLLQSQAALLGQSRLSSLLGGQLPSSLLQGAAGLGAATAGGLLHAPGGLAQAAQPLQNIRPFDHTITLEARSKHAFPVKLYRMIERAERNGQDDIISFIDDGKAFAIHKPRAFEMEIMPSYFNSHRMSSFQRQLNIYVSTHSHRCLSFLAKLIVLATFSHDDKSQGFERINDGIQKGAYRHKYFIKDKKDLLEKIKRPQKLRQGGSVEDEDEDPAKLQAMAAEHLVGLSRAPGNSKGEDKDEDESSGGDGSEKE